MKKVEIDEGSKLVSLAGGMSSGCREFVFLHGMQQPMKHLGSRGSNPPTFRVSRFSDGSRVSKLTFENLELVCGNGSKRTRHGQRSDVIGVTLSLTFVDSASSEKSQDISFGTNQKPG